MISTKKRTEVLMMSISMGILVALGSIGIVKTASAVEPPVTQEEARAASETTDGEIGVGVNEEGQGKVIGVGYATDGSDATGKGGLIGVGYGGDAQDGGDGGTGTGEGPLLAAGYGGDAQDGGDGGTGIARS
jgi:hypothetical protein